MPSSTRPASVQRLATLAITAACVAGAIVVSEPTAASAAPLSQSAIENLLTSGAAKSGAPQTGSSTLAKSVTSADPDVTPALLIPPTPPSSGAPTLTPQLAAEYHLPYDTSSSATIVNGRRLSAAAAKAVRAHAAQQSVGAIWCLLLGATTSGGVTVYGPTIDSAAGIICNGNFFAARIQMCRQVLIDKEWYQFPNCQNGEAALTYLLLAGSNDVCASYQAYRVWAWDWLPFFVPQDGTIESNVTICPPT